MALTLDDPAGVLALREKLQGGLVLTADEADFLRSLMVMCEGDFYPSKAEFEAQMARVNLLTPALFDANPERWNQIMADCNHYESKYC